MKNRIVEIPGPKEPIMKSPGFAKKGLSTYKVDFVKVCAFRCSYCSTTECLGLKFSRKSMLAATKEQLGEFVLPSDDPSLTFVHPDLLDNMYRQLQSRNRNWGKGETLMVSMLTDPFSPPIVADGTTMNALQMLLEHTQFRLRILTKSAAVASPEFLELFLDHPGRFVVGLSIGTTDDEWAKRIELGTSIPSTRIKALHILQNAGIPTFGMLCPIFPDVLMSGGLEKLVQSIDPQIAEEIWGEPFNDRQNWEVVRSGYPEGSAGYNWCTAAFGQKNKRIWSRYATELYTRLHSEAIRTGWIHKLRYLLYEGNISADDVKQLSRLEGVLLQCKPGENGLSQNPAIATLQISLRPQMVIHGPADLSDPILETVAK